MHAVMKNWHPMIGYDMHIPWPPGSPTPAPSPAPYYTVQLLNGLVPGVFAQLAMSHMSMGFGVTMQAPTDIGSGIGHVGVPSVLLPVEIALSSSKSYFGPSTNLAEGKPICAALVLNFNPNLNCGTPMPLPVGCVVALNTHYVGMTLGDILGGAAAMLTDFVIQTALNKLGNAAAGRISNYITSKLAARVEQRALMRLLGDVAERWPQTRAMDAGLDFAARWGPRLDNFVVGNILGFWTGGPMGADAGSFGLPTLAGGASESAANAERAGYQYIGDSVAPDSSTQGAADALNNFFNGPGVDDY